MLAVGKCNSKVNLYQFALTKGIFKKVSLAKVMVNSLGLQMSLTPNNTELKQATFLSQGWKPKVNMLHARTVVSP